jgi:hypothetical protein
MDAATTILYIILIGFIIGAIGYSLYNAKLLHDSFIEEKHLSISEQSNYEQYMRDNKIPLYADKLLQSPYLSHETDGYGKYIWNTYSEGIMMANTYNNSLDGTLPGIEIIDVDYYDLSGDVYSSVSGGGSSLKGAVAGAIVAGGVGVVVGSRKKITTEIHDARKVLLVYKSDSDHFTNAKSLILEPDAYHPLMTHYPLKNKSYLNKCLS